MNMAPSTEIDEGETAAPPAGPVLTDDGGGNCSWTWSGDVPPEWRLEQYSAGVWVQAGLYPAFVTSATGVATGLATRVAGVGALGVLKTGYSNIVLLA
jgi:hypothetical protein